MLQTIRDGSKGIIAGVIVFLISLTFVLWGVQSYIDGDSQVVVAEADGQEILLQEFQESLQRYRTQAQSVLGEEFDSGAWDSPEVRQRALDQLIDERILGRVINSARISIADVQVARQLQQIPAFQADGTFSRDLYVQRVPLLGLSPTGFEQKLREDMARAQLRAGIAASEFVTQTEAEVIQQLREQKRDIGYATIPASDYSDQITVSEDDISTYFAKHAETFRVAERVTLRYLEISAATLHDRVEISEDVLQEVYESNKATYTVDEERNVNHILVHTPEVASGEEEAAALEKIALAMARTKGGEAFETVAQELSDDVGSSADGGETGYFPRGVMAPEFEQAAFDLEVGGVSEPVRTKFGYHLIKLKAIKPGGTKTFAEARAEVETAYREAEAQRMFIDQADQFANLVYEHPDGLDVAAESLTLNILETENLGRSEIAALFSDKVASAAFETEVLLEGLNAEPIELDDGRVVAIRVGEHFPARIPPLADVREDIEAAIVTEKGRALTEAAGKSLLERLRGGALLSEVVEEVGLGWESVEAAGRESNEVNRAVLRAAFRVSGSHSAPVFEGIPMGNADYAVIRIANIATPATDELDDAEVGRIQKELVGSRAESTWREFVGALRSRSDVEVYRNNL